MPAFCHLSEPDRYRPCDWDLLTDRVGRDHWIDEFLAHGDAMLAHTLARRDPPPGERVESMRRAYREALEALRRRPEARGRLDVLELCILRDELLGDYELGDPYADVKALENEASIECYPSVIERIEETPVESRVELLLRCVLAGNRFDLGSPVTSREYDRGRMDFFAELDRLPPRPWFADDVEALAPAFDGSEARYGKVMVFVDNAGADIVLGVLPLARHLAGLGMRVVLAATDHYALNDVTRDELDAIVDSVKRLDEVFARHVAGGRITVVGTGYTHPLIDLANVSEECNAAAADCDLIVLEGMGRAIESNYRTPLRRDCLRLAMIKNEAVARHYGCELFDLVCRLTPGT